MQYKDAINRELSFLLNWDEVTRREDAQSLERAIADARNFLSA